MKAKKFTKIFIASLFILIVIVDIVLLKLNATISKQMKIWGNFLFMPFECGVLMAHFFGFPVKKPDKHILKLAIFGGVMLIASIIMVLCKVEIHYSVPALMFFAGLPVGNKYWNQKYIKEN